MSLTNNKKEQDVEKRKDANDKEEEAKSKSSQKSSDEVQELQRKGLKSSDKSLDDARNAVKSEIDRDNPLELVEGNERRGIKGLELDKDGQPAKYKDSLGETYVKRDGAWYRHGLLSPEGERVEDVKLDKEGNLNITYKVPEDDANPNSKTDSVTRQIRPDGTESTLYPNSKTLTSRESDGTKVVTVLQKEEIEGGVCKAPLQTVKFAVVDQSKPPQCVYFQDAQNNTYEMDRNTKEWTKKDASGNKDENWQGKVTADSDGCACVFNNNLAGTEQASLRYFPDGTVANAKDSKNRTLTLTDGTTIQNSSGNTLESSTMTAKRPDGSTTKIDFDRDGNATQVSYTKDGQTQIFHRQDPTGINGVPMRSRDAVWFDADGRQVNIDDKTVLSAPNGKQVNLAQMGTPEQFTSAGNNPIEYRPLIQEVPENYESLLQARLKECRDNAGNWNMYKKTHDGGEWDDKQAGGQYQAWGNAAWGMYANEMGYEFANANAAVGMYKILSGKSRIDWAASDTLGQNPADYELTKRGYELRERQRQNQDVPLKSSQGIDLPHIPDAEKNPNIEMRNARREIDSNPYIMVA
jgi:hypothetical protein